VTIVTPKKSPREDLNARVPPSQPRIGKKPRKIAAIGKARAKAQYPP
jgi:hypothetical protein